MLRELITRLNRTLAERAAPARRPHCVPVKVWFDADIDTELEREKARAACIIGETVDISRSGVGFLVPFIRVKEKYLVGQERPINLEMDLPNGKVRMRLLGRRYNKVGMHTSTERFLVGARIIEMAEEDRAAYETFLKRGARRASGRVASLEAS